MRISWWLAVAACVAVDKGGLRADDQADMRALVDRAVKACGGEDRVAKLRGATWKTKVTVANETTPSYTDETSAQGLDQYRADITVRNGDKTSMVIMLANRDKGWYHQNGKTMDVPADFLKVRMDVYHVVRLPQLLLPLKGKDCKLSPLGETKIADRPAIGVHVERAGHADLNVWFDKESGLYVKSEARLTITDGREVVVAFQVSEYKEFDGLKHFTRVALHVEDETLFEGEISDVKALGELAQGTFNKP